MKKDDLNHKLHEVVKENKEHKKLSYSKLGDSVGYSDVGFMQALKKERLSHDDILIIANKFGFVSEIEELGLKNPKSKGLNGKFIEASSIEFLENQVLEKWDLLMKRPGFKAKVDGFVKDEIILRLEDIIRKS